MATKCEFCPIRRKDIFAPMNADDIAVIQKFKVGELVVNAGTQLLMEGSNSPQLYTVLHGMGLRYKNLENGERQVVNFVFPGDFLGLQAGVMGEMGHSVEATSKMTLCVFDRTELWKLIRQNPKRGYELIWLAATEEHFLGETLATVGQRTAMQALAWALVKMFRRAEASGLTNQQSMRFPYRQQDLADALGLSLVHTNKTISQLRSRQLISWTGDEVHINDIEALSKIGMTNDDAPRQRPII